MLILTLALLGIPGAHAQGFDAHGPNLPPESSSVRDPVFGFGGMPAGAPVLTFLTEATNDVLVQRISDGPDLQDVPVVDALFGAELGFQSQLSGRVGLGATLPTWFASDGEAGGGLALGDLGLWVPVSVLAKQVRLSAVPFATVPTGANARYLGEPGFTVGTLASGGLTLGFLTAGLDVGLDLAPRTDVPEWPGGLHTRYAASAGFAPSDALAVHLESRSRIPIASAAPTLPSEVAATVKVRPRERVWVTGSLGRAITRGVGAPGVRMLIGVNVSPGSDPVGTEVVEAPIPSEVLVQDERRYPITNATVTAGGYTTTTDYEGYAAIPPRALRSGAIQIQHPMYEDALLEGVSTEDEWWTVTMQRRPVDLRVQVVGPEGPLEAYNVALEGPYEPEAPTVDEAGMYQWQLRPGAWTVKMSSPGMGDQARTIVIEFMRTEPIRVDAVLTPLVDDSMLEVSVVDRLGRPVEDAIVALEDRDLGTTGTGGDLVVYGLGGNEKDLVVRSERFGDATTLEIVVDESGEARLEAVLDWQPGSVQVTAIDPNGQPVDADVRFVGPATLPSRSVGSDGEEVFVLRPGSWEVEVSAPGLSTQRRTIEVTEERGELVVVDVGLLPEEEGTAELELRVADVDGRAISGAEVTVDGNSAGRTSEDGVVVLSGLDAGEREIRVAGELLRTTEANITVYDGQQVEDLTVQWMDGVTDVRVTGEDGAPVDAVISFEGPEPIEDIAIGMDGEERVVLPAGTWEMTISSEGKADQTRTVVVESGTQRRTTVGVQLEAEDTETGGLQISVVDAQGNEVENAQVLLDGQYFGDASNGQFEAEGLSVGRHEISVFADGMSGTEIEVEVTEDGIEEVDVELDWTAGATQVRVMADDEPVEGTVRAFSEDGEIVELERTTEGQTLLELRPGAWTLEVRSDEGETRQLEIDIDEDTKLTQVDVDLSAEPEDDATEAPREASVVLRAETPDGEVLADAVVKVDGEIVGTTDRTGSFTITEFEGSSSEVEILPETGSSLESVALTVDRPKEEGRATVVVPYAEQEVSIEVETSSGETVQAEIIAVGSGVDQMATVEGGVSTLNLRPGTYNIVARTESGGVATAEVVVRAGEEVVVRETNDANALGIPVPSAQVRADAGAGSAVLQLTVQETRSVVEGSKVVPPEPILFDLAMSDLREDVILMVHDIALWLASHPEAALVEIGGHTDNLGGVAYNQQLSERRAQSVREALESLGIAPERLRARGYGLSRPVTRNTDEAGRARNRRVEVVVLQWSGEAE